MPKRKSKRKPKTRPSSKPVEVPKADWAIVTHISRYHGIVILLLVIPVTYLSNNYERIDKAVGGILGGWMSIVAAFALIGTFMQVRRLYQPDLLSFLTNSRKLRRHGVFLLGLAIFINLMAWLPIIYANGYFAGFYTFLPGRTELGDKASVGIAFILGAIVSGVLGNFVYDILKFIFKKMVDRGEK